MKQLTEAQLKAIHQLPMDGSFGIPLSTTHNGTLASLIRRGIIEWSGGYFASVWQLNHGSFRLTASGLTRARADAPGVPESKDDSPADVPSDAARGSA